jgi:hypothetical protein
MNLARVSKKVPHADYRMTLDALHEKKLRDYEEYYKELPNKKMLLNQLKMKYETLPVGVSKSIYSEKLQERTDLYEEIEELEKEVYNMENRTEEINYLLTASNYIKKYAKNKYSNKIDEKDDVSLYSTTPDEKGYEAEDDDEESLYYNYITKKSSLQEYVEEKQVSQKGQICGDYAENCLGLIIDECAKKRNNVFKNHTLKKLHCIECNVPRYLNTTEASAVCPECGDACPYQDTQTTIEFSEEIEMLSPFALICLALKSTLQQVSRQCLLETYKTSGFELHYSVLQTVLC